MRVVCIVQARVGSRRFPNKATQLICGKTMTERVLLRAQRIAGIDEVVLTTPMFPEDQILGGMARRLGVSHYPADHSDLLAVFARCARYHRAGVIVRITGDCPLLDPTGSASVLKYMLSGPYDYVSNISPVTDGLDTEVMTAAALSSANRDSHDPYERHHVTPYIRRHSELFRIGTLVPSSVPDGLKWSVDLPDDLERVRRAYEQHEGAVAC